MLLREVLKIKETVIAEKQQELKRRLNWKIDYKGSQIFFLNQPDVALRR